MILAIGFHEVMAALCIVAITFLCAFMVGWLFYCITSVARAADALERIADALEDKDTAKKGGEE